MDGEDRGDKEKEKVEAPFLSPTLCNVGSSQSDQPIMVQ